MYQSITSNNRSIVGEKADSKTSHFMDIALLAILVTCLFSCLVRSDYNFAIGFFCYFVWQQRKDSLALKLIIASTVLTVLYDLLFWVLEIRVWLVEDPSNAVWQTLRPMHCFGVFCFFLCLVFKIVVLVLGLRALRQINKVVQVK